MRPPVHPPFSRAAPDVGTLERMDELTTQRRAAVEARPLALGCVLLVASGVLLVVTGVLLVLPLRSTWLPCFEAAYYDTRECVQLQTDFAGGAENAVWLVLAAAGLLALAVSVWARRIRPPTGLFAVVVGVLLAGSPLADYVMVPFFNGGYVSHDSAPGMGMWTCACIVAAGLVLVGGAAARRRRGA
jgi:hypothetical protein